MRAKLHVMTSSTGKSTWYGEGAEMESLEQELEEHGGWGAPNNPRVREFVAREVVDGELSEAELGRNHDLPLSRIRKWVEVYKAEGRAGLEALTDKTHER